MNAIFHFLQDFYTNFFLFTSKLSEISSRITQPYVRCFCFHHFVNRRMAEQKLLKMKNDFHLEVAGWIKKLSPDSNLEKEIGLHNPPQVSGYFYVEQTSFLWMVW